MLLLLLIKKHDDDDDDDNIGVSIYTTLLFYIFLSFMPRYLVYLLIYFFFVIKIKLINTYYIFEIFAF